MSYQDDAIRYYELIREGMSPKEAFHTVFPNGIPTEEDRMREAAEEQQKNALGQTAGLVTGALGTTALIDYISGEPILGGLISSTAPEAATTAATTAASTGASLGGTAATGAMSGQGALIGAPGGGGIITGGGGGSAIGGGGTSIASEGAAQAAVGPQWGAAAGYMAIPLALATVAPAIAKALRDDTESSRQLDPRIDLAGIAQSLPGGENMSEEQLMGAMEILDQQGRLHKGGFMRIADPTKENPLGSVADAVPAIIRSDRVMNRLKGDAFGENKYKSGFEYMQDLMMDRNNAHLSKDPMIQGLLNQSAPEGYEGKLGSDLIASLAQYKDPNTAMTFSLMPQGVEAQSVPTPEQMAESEAAPVQQVQPAAVTPVSPTAQREPFSDKEFDLINNFGADVASNYRDINMNMNNKYLPMQMQLPQQMGLMQQNPGTINDTFGNTGLQSLPQANFQMQDTGFSKPQIDVSNAQAAIGQLTPGQSYGGVIGDLLKNGGAEKVVQRQPLTLEQKNAILRSFHGM